MFPLPSIQQLFMQIQYIWIVLLFLTLLSPSHSALNHREHLFEAATETLFLHHTQLTSAQHRPDVFPFSISFKQNFKETPFLLLAPFASSYHLQENQNVEEKASRVKVRLLVLRQIFFRMEASTTGWVAFIKISYLAASQETAHIQGLHLLQIQEKDRSEETGLTTVRQISYDVRLGERQVIAEKIGIAPVGVEGQVFVFTQQLRMNGNRQQYFNLTVNQVETIVEIIYAYDSQADAGVLSFPAYTLLIKQQKQGRQIFVEQISLSIDHPSFSRRISDNRAVFLGLTGYQLPSNSQSQLNIDISIKESSSFLTSDNAQTDSSKLSFIILEIGQTQEEYTITKRLLLTCAVPTFVTTYVNSWTTWTDPTNTSSQSCQPCPTGCYNCTYCSNCLRFVNCTLCRTGFTFVKLGLSDYPSNQYVCRCATGNPNATTNTCMACNLVIANCGSCKTYASGHYSATCATCNNGYFAVANSGSWGGYTQCQACTGGCASCTTNTTCKTCSPGLISSSGVCSCPSGLYYSTITPSCTSCPNAILNCVACVAVSTTTTCTTCTTGYYVSAGACAPCSSNCNSCTALVCSSCKPTFVVSGSTCICDATASMFYDSVSGTCLTCTSFVANCATCVAGTPVTCSTCSAGTYLSSSTVCTNCPSGCTLCSDAVTCSACVSNLEVIGGLCNCNNTLGNYLNPLTMTCYSCSQIIALCSACTFNGVTSTVECTTSVPGAYLASTTSSLPCPSTCTTCSDAVTCGGCITGYTLSGTFTCDCTNCVTCSALGLPNCADCVNIAGTDTCTVCVTGTYLDAGNLCQTCPVGCATCTSAACTSCTLPFIPSSPAGSCICNSLALQYYNPSTFTCDTCTSIIPSCTGCSTVAYVTTCSGCTAGNFLGGNVCTPCTAPCTTCTSAVVCNSCSATYSLIGNSCVCDNANQIFYNTITTVCSTCAIIAGSQCTACAVNGMSPLGVACTTCNNGYFPDPATYLCSSCPSTCTVCSSLASCSICATTFVLTLGSCQCNNTAGEYLFDGLCTPCSSIFNYCLTCDNSTTVILCTACASGTYLSATQDSCILCPTNCNTCNAAGCTICNSGYLPNAGGVCQCLTSCVAFANADPSCVDCSLSVNATANTSTLMCTSCKATTFVVSNESCNACPTTCATCTDYVTCLTCKSSYSLINSNCVCNTFFNEVQQNGYCHQCGELVTGCKVCGVSGGVNICTTCQDGWGLESGVCTICGDGCAACTVSGGVVTCTTCSINFSFSMGTCTTATGCVVALSQYYDAGTTSCVNCMANCKTCYTASTCVECKPTFRLIKGTCSCDTGLNYFYNSLLFTCALCNTTQDGALAYYLANCEVCQQSLAHYTTGIECLDCLDGFYLSAGTCLSCSMGCQKCTGAATCCFCNTPSWLMNNGTCVCNNALNYFFDGVSSCLPCTIANCSTCTSLTVCQTCNLDSFVNGLGVCQLTVCGNGAVQGIQACDDGNTVNGDGCSSLCVIESYYFCVNVPAPSICLYDSRFNVKLKDQTAGCNQLTFQFQIYPYYDYYSTANYDTFISNYNLTALSKLSHSLSGDTLTYIFSFNITVQGMVVNFTFDPSTLGIPQTASYPTTNISFTIKPTNNILAIHYDNNVCDSKKAMQKVTDAIEYTSYATLIMSALPCKIVGLELFGVIQLTFLSLGSMDNVNILMSPMMGMKGVNGFSFNLGDDQKQKRMLQSTLTPDRINSIGYRANFLRNCNAMFIIVVAIILVASVLYFVTFLCKSCSMRLHSISKRMIKEILLTMILFNCLNFAYSAGIHFKYASVDDSLYTLGTIAAACTLIIPVLMALGLCLADEDGFGEFKDKLKNGCAEKAYFLITIVYRMCLGLYMSTSNQDELSTLIVLAISILFLLYNLVNLPFAKAYHNYRANVCHITQFICLFITMYYRSMKSSANSEHVAGIYSPVYLEYGCIFVSLVVSMVVLAYEIYLFVKECMTDREKEKDEERKRSCSESDLSELGQKVANHTLKSIQSENNEKPIEVLYEESDLYN